MKKIRKQKSKIFVKKEKKMEQKLTKKQQKELVAEIWKDFRQRQEERRPFETQWQLNINFLMGNQYCDINSNSILKQMDKQYYWEERETFNHIAPLMETRQAKLALVKPTMVVLPASSDEEDVSNAKVCKNILDSLCSKIDFSKITSQATYWSEICGTAFYKVVWNSSAGSIVGLTPMGEKIYEGDVDVLVCSPFEIFPDSNSAMSLSQCKSLIHARSYDTDTIEKLWGIKVEGSDIDSYALSSVHTLNHLSIAGFSKVSKTMKHNQAMVIEKYEMPTTKYPNGRLLIVVENELVFDGELPYKNLKDGERGFPFVRQVAVEQPLLFWGSSVVERLIPIQRAYNAVKNRKHEFMNRTSLGVLAVEDGSIDIDSLEEEGIGPGKILVYRQGSNLPHMMNSDVVPVSFSEEEEKLLSEFLVVSGVNDIFSTNAESLATLSGVALQLLIEQENARISASSENIKFAIKEVAQQMLRLCKQFVAGERVSRIIGQNGAANFFYWDKGNISSDEVTFDTQSENIRSLAQRRAMVFDLLKQGVLTDETGKLSNEMRQKILDMAGFGLWEESLDNNALQIQKAKRENIALLVDHKEPEVLEIHDHQLHISSHIAFMLSRDFEEEAKKYPKLQDIMLEHIRKHKQFESLNYQAEQIQNN